MKTPFNINEFAKVLTEADESAEFTQEVFDKAEKEINAFIKKETGFDFDLKVKFDGKKITTTSKDLAKNMKPTMFKELNAIVFNSGEIKDSGEFWLNLNYRYKSFSGGSNGISIGDVWVKKDGSIISRTDLK